MDSGHLLSSRRAQSSVIGIVLIIGLTLAAASAVVVYGSDAIDDGRQESRIGQAEQAMTQFDSRTAQVALGDSDTQTVQLGQGQGTYRVNGSAGYIKIYHEDWNDSETSDHQEDIYERELGALVYENGDTTIAYQGGGVWRRDANGGSTMVSPPEVHNRKATLTLPVIRVSGNGASSGQTKANVRSVVRGKPLFPDLENETTPHSDQYSESSEHFYENPVQTGNMTVEIDSEYCEAWRQFFLSRTDGRVDDCDDGSVTAQIVALGTQGGFDISGQGALSIRGVESMEEFVFRMEESHRGSSTFNRLDWEMYAEEGDEELKIWFGAADKAKCDESVQLEITYSNESSTQQWRNDTEFPLASSSTCDDDLYMEADLLDSNVKMDALADPVTIGGTTYNSSNPPTLDVIVEHYFTLLEDADFTIEEHNNAHMSDTSQAWIEYEGGGQVVTYLHVTENEVEIALE